jgi:hypothetical protein
VRQCIIVCLIATGPALAAEPWPEPNGTIDFRETIGNVGRTVLDSSGDIWFVENVAGHHPSGADGGIYLLTEKGWTATPVKQRTRPVWNARLGPPWQRWAGPAALVTGENGAALAVVTRDIYQDMAAELPKESTTWEIQKIAEEKYADVREKFWLDAWLRKDGKWVGPMRLEKLIRQERESIRGHFRETRSLNTYFDLVSDGETIWTVFNGTLSAHNEDDVRSISLTPAPRWAGVPLVGARFVRHSDGLWVVTKSEKGFRIAAVTLAKGRIVLMEWPKLPDARRVDRAWALPRFHFAKDGRRIAWVPEYEPVTSHPYFLENGAWKVREDLDAFQFEDADGGLWFRLETRWKESSGFAVLKGDEMERFAVPNVWPVALTAGEKKRFVLYTDQYKKENHRVAELSTTGKPGAGGWKVEAIYAITSGPHVPTQLIADRWGNLVTEYGAVGRPVKK